MAEKSLHKMYLRAMGLIMEGPKHGSINIAVPIPSRYTREKRLLLMSQVEGVLLYINAIGFFLRGVSCTQIIEQDDLVLPPNVLNLLASRDHEMRKITVDEYEFGKKFKQLT